MTNFRGWVSRIGLHGSGSDQWSHFELCALTVEGPVEMVAGPDLMSLSWYPPDRLALGPVTFGGMVVHRSSASVRVVCLDNLGDSAVWVGSSTGLEQQNLEASDVDAIAVMWHLMNSQSTRPVVDEILGRLLLWAWIADTQQWLRRGSQTSHDRHDQWHLVPARIDGSEPGVRAFSRGDLHALAELLAVPLETPVTPASISRLALLVDHPPLEVSNPVVGRTLADEVDYLHACVPTRWSIAADLRSRHRRGDLAEMVMAAPTPDL